MEQNFYIKLNKVKETIHLSKDEKMEMKDNLLKVMGEVRPVVSPYNKSSNAKYFALASIVIFGGATVSFAAQNSLPGDLLYPIKVNVNEKIVAKLQTDDLAKASYEISLANRRLEEASALKARGIFNDEIKKEVQDNFNEHTILAQSGVIVVGESGNATASAILNTNLNGVIENAKRVFGIVNATTSESVEVKMDVPAKKQVPKVIKKANIVAPKVVATTTTNVKLDVPVQLPKALPIEIPVVVPEPVETSGNINTTVNTPVGNTNANTNVNTNPIQQVTNPVTNTVNNTIKKIGF